jgi:hypothetical protein
LRKAVADGPGVESTGPPHNAIAGDLMTRVANPMPKSPQRKLNGKRKGGCPTHGGIGAVRSPHYSSEADRP